MTKPRKSQFLETPVEPFRVEAGLPADEVLRRMERISFQGRNLATAHRIWQRMLGDELLIFLGVAGALSAGGLRLVIAELIRRRAVDCVVSTGANLYHDLHETRGQRHFLGSPRADDRALAEAHIDRVYDTFVDEDEFIRNDNWIARFATTLDPRPYTTREFLYRLGERLWTETEADGILTAAYRARVPGWGCRKRGTMPPARVRSMSLATSSSRPISSFAGHVPRPWFSEAERRRTSSTRRACRRRSIEATSRDTATRCR